MVLYVKQMFDEVDDLLDQYQPVDPNNTVLTWDMKRHYLNMGQYAMWPRIFRVVQDISVEMGSGYQEYIFPESVRGGRLVYVEMETDEVSNTYVLVPEDSYSIIPGPGRADILKLAYTEAEGRRVRITTTQPLAPIAAVDAAAAAIEPYTGPEFSIEAPALYAMNRITARGLHSRLDYGRQSVDFNNRSAVPNELMASSIFWLDEFERRVDMWQLVHPQSVA